MWPVNGEDNALKIVSLHSKRSSIDARPFFVPPRIVVIGDARPTALQIIRDEGVEGKLGGKVIVITGASSGIGLETARALSLTGATLFLTTLNLKTAKIALARVMEAGRASLVEMDNNSSASIRTAAKTILKLSNNKVNILINNAGVMGVQELKLTEDGQEIHFATNYLSQFLLFQLLKPALLTSATRDFHSRVVNVSSSAHRAGKLPDNEQLQLRKRKIQPRGSVCELEACLYLPG